MQADSSAVKFIGSRTFKGKESGEDLFTVTVADEKGRTMQFFVPERDYLQVQNIPFGNDLQMIFEIYPRSSGVGVRCTEIIVG